METGRVCHRAFAAHFRRLLPSAPGLGDASFYHHGDFYLPESQQVDVRCVRTALAELVFDDTAHLVVCRWLLCDPQVVG